MGYATDSAVMRGLRAVFDGGSAAGLGDGALLERFACRGDESAFAALVDRHGPMVWRACRAALRDEHEAEDAFQAVFLVLARKARSLWVRDSLGPWLHQVALRTSAYARSEARRRRDLHRRWGESATRILDEPPRDDPAAAVHEELGRLPDRYRAPLVLCDLEGLSHEEAAGRLGWPIGTVKSRQSRGRARLRDRLIRRGYGPSAGVLAALHQAEGSSVPAGLLDATIALGRTAGAVPASVAALAGRGAWAMTSTRLQAFTATAALGLVAIGAAVLARAPGPDAPTASGVGRAAGPAAKPDRVLFLQGPTFSWEPKYLARALDRDLPLDLRTLRAEGQAQDEDFVPGRYGAYIVADLSARLLTTKQQDRLARTVEAGAGLIFVGGRSRFEGWDAGPLAGLVPMAADPEAKPENVPGGVHVVPTAIGATSPVLAIGETPAESARRWAALPPLPSVDRIGPPKPPTMILATTEGGVPLIVALEVGRGRVLAIGAETWPWARGPGEASASHRRFWLQALAWACHLDAPAALPARRPDEPPAKPAAAPAKPAARPIRDVLRDAAQKAAPDGDKAAAYLLLQIARAQARAGDREGALATARRVSEVVEGPGSADTLIALAYVRDAAGDRAGGMKELDRADRFPDERTGVIETQVGPNRRSWFPARRLIAEARFDLGDVEGARATVQVMTIGIDALPKGNGRILPASELATAQVKVGDVDGAFRTADQVNGPGIRAGDRNKGHVLREIAQAAASATHWHLQPRKALSPEEREARRPILKRVEEVAEGFEFAEDRPDVDLAIAWAKLGDFESALRVAHRIGVGPIRFANGLDPSAPVYVLSVIGGMQGKAGRKTEAAVTLREALDLVERHPEFASRRSQVAGNQLLAGDAAGAARTMESASPEERTRWLAGVARHQSEAGDRAAARATWLAALRESERLVGAPAPPPNKVEIEMRRMDPTSVPADRDLAHKESALSQIAAIRASLGDLDAATATLRKITPGSWSSRSCAQDIARARVEEGDVEGALDWAMSLEPQLRVEALRGLAEGFTDR